MEKYIFIYHGSGSAPENEEEGKKVMQAWMEWFEVMGEAVVDMGAPIGMSSTVHSGGKVSSDGGSNPASGYTIIQANTLNEALEHAKGCPLLEDEGSIEVAQIHSM